jgi:hypothetical protein
MTDVITSEEFYDSDQWHRHQRNLLRRRVVKFEQRLDEVIARLDAMQGNRKGITDNQDYIESVNPDYIPVDDDGVWKVSSTTMNLLYAMYLWADKNGIDNEDDWENHLKLMREHLNNLQGAK